MKKIFSFFLKDLKQSLILSIIAIFFVLYSVLIVRFFPYFYGRILLVSFVIICLIFSFLPIKKEEKRK